MSSSGDLNRSNELPPSSSHNSSQTPPPHLQQALPGSPPIVTWAPPPKPGSFRPAGGGLAKPQPQVQTLNRPAPFTSLSTKGFVPTGGSSSSSGKELSSQGAGEGNGSGGSTRDSRGGRTESEQQDQQQEEGEDTSMAAPRSNQSKCQVGPRQSPPRPRPNGKAQRDLSHLRLGGNNSPIPPPIYRTSVSPPLPAAFSHAANPSHSTSSSSHSQQPLTRPFPSSTSSTSSSNQQSAPPASSVNQSQSQKTSNQIPKKRAYSNDSQSQSQHRNSPAPPPPPQPRSNSATNPTKSHSITSSSQGGEARQSQVKRTKFSSEVKQCVSDGRAMHGALSDMLHVVQNMETEIVNLNDQLTEKSRELLEVSEEKELFKTKMIESSRQAIKKVEEANQALATTYSEARNALAAQDNGNSFSTVIEELRRDLDSLKKDINESVAGVDGSSKLEKNEGTKLEILRELQSQLATREEVHKLLRADLESRTGELAEARDTISNLNTAQQKAYQRIDYVTAELNSTRLSADQDKQKRRDQLDKALLDAVEREQTLLKQNEDSIQKWSNALLESKNAENKLEIELRELRNVLQAKEEEIIQTWKLKLSEVQQKYEEEIRTISNTNAGERMELTFNLKVARDQLESLKHEFDRREEALSRMQVDVKALVESSERDQEALRTSRLELEQLQSRLAEKTADVDDYEARLHDLQNRLSEAESSAAVTFQLEIERIEKEKREASSAKKGLEEELAALNSEHGTLTSTVSRLESSLATAQSTNSSLESKILDLVEKLSDSEATRSDQSSKLESKDEELRELRALKDSFEKEKEKYANEEKEKLRSAFLQAHTKDKINLTNENKKLRNQLANETKKLRKTQIDLAEARGKNVMNPVSSSNGSAGSNGENRAGDGGSEKSNERNDDPGKSGENIDDSQSQEDATTKPRISLSAIEQTATLAGDGNSRKSSSLSPPQLSQAAEVEQSRDSGGEEVGTGNPLNPTNPSIVILAPQTAALSRLRKRSIENHEDDLDSTEQNPIPIISKSSKRPRRTVSNENKEPHGQDNGGNSKSKLRVPAQQNKYNATTKKKK
ncbi:hypothetical protein JCM3765_004588 [Sporobolomyces pararoseus]